MPDDRPAGNLSAGIRQHLWAKPGRLGAIADADRPTPTIEDLATVVREELGVDLEAARRLVRDVVRAEDDGA